VPRSEPYDGIVEDVCLAAPQNQKIWRKEGQKDTKVAIKCYYKDEIVIFRGEAIRYAQVRTFSPPFSEEVLTVWCECDHRPTSSSKAPGTFP
jgi:hypothetical protein